MNATAVLAEAPELVQPVASGWQLVLAFLAGIAVIVVLITWARLHPFLALIFGALSVGIVAGENLEKVLKSFSDGFGSTAAGVGILIALSRLSGDNEITAVLDIVGRQKFMQVLKTANQERQCSIVMATNILEDLVSYASHVLLIKKGKCDPLKSLSEFLGKASLNEFSQIVAAKLEAA